MKPIIIVSALLFLLQGHLFCQGRYLVTNTLISQYDSVANTWTEPSPEFLHNDYDAVITFYRDSIYYVVNESKNKHQQHSKHFTHTGNLYNIRMSLLKRQMTDLDSCYSTYDASIIEKGQRNGPDYYAAVPNNKALAEVRLLSCYDIADFKNTSTPAGSVRITINQAPLHTGPYSKWRLILNICRLP